MKETKKTYEKPKVSKVTLRPEESLVTACKTHHTGGPGATPCTQAAVICMDAGS